MSTVAVVNLGSVTMRRFLVLWILTFLCLSSATRGEESCGAEVKLLLFPGDVKSAVRSFDAGRGTPGEVYFFDTSTLDLLSQGIILRLRRGANADFTVKLRPPINKTILGISGHNERYKCEVDLTADAALRSYSVQTRFIISLPETGIEVSRLLSPAQNQLLEQSNASIDWNRIKRIAEIKSTDWIIRNQRPFSKLELELWEWPEGSVLELSTKIKADTASADVYAQIRDLAVSKGLSPNTIQKSKTTLALEEIVRATVH